MSYKRWLLIAVGLFGAGFGVGLISGMVAPSSVAELFAEDISALENLAGSLSSLPKVSVFLLILLKNVSAVLISFIFSPLLLLVPVLALFFNGGLLGFVSAVVLKEESLGYLLAGLMPHGIFELPALIIGEAAALSFGIAALSALFNKEKRSQLLPHIKQDARYLMIAFVLLIPAALIETYVTPLLID